MVEMFDKIDVSCPYTEKWHPKTPGPPADTCEQVVMNIYWFLCNSEELACGVIEKQRKIVNAQWFVKQQITFLKRRSK